MHHYNTVRHIAFLQYINVMLKGYYFFFVFLRKAKAFPYEKTNRS